MKAGVGRRGRHTTGDYARALTINTRPMCGRFPFLSLSSPSLPSPVIVPIASNKRAGKRHLRRNGHGEHDVDAESGRNRERIVGDRTEDDAGNERDQPTAHLPSQRRATGADLEVAVERSISSRH